MQYASSVLHISSCINVDWGKVRLAEDVFAGMGLLRVAAAASPVSAECAPHPAPAWTDEA